MDDSNIKCTKKFKEIIGTQADVILLLVKVGGLFIVLTLPLFLESGDEVWIYYLF